MHNFSKCREYFRFFQYALPWLILQCIADFDRIATIVNYCDLFTHRFFGYYLIHKSTELFVLIELEILRNPANL